MKNQWQIGQVHRGLLMEKMLMTRRGMLLFRRTVEFRYLELSIKGNENLFEIAGVRHSEGGVKLHPEHIYRR